MCFLIINNMQERGSLMGAEDVHIQEILDTYLQELRDSNQFKGNGSVQSARISPMVRRSLQFLLDHLYDPALTVELLREACGINGHDFSGIFKFYIGRTPIEFINYHLVEAAMQLLRDGRLKGVSISRIGIKVGFRRPSTFSKAFKREVGVSPSVWRTKQLAL